MNRYDLELPSDFSPYNGDGEVEAFTLMPVTEALESIQANLTTCTAGLGHTHIPSPFDYHQGSTGMIQLHRRSKPCPVGITTHSPPPLFPLK